MNSFQAPCALRGDIVHSLYVLTTVRNLKMTNLPNAPRNRKLGLPQDKPSQYFQLQTESKILTQAVAISKGQESED